MPNKKLSIIIPCFNCSSTLAEAVLTCYEQGFSIAEFEIILVDDKSTDSTREVMKTLSQQKSNIHIFYHEKNKGGGATRNTAVSKAINAIIFCLDSDDMLPPHTLDKMYDHLITKGCDGVGLNYSTKFVGDDTSNIYRVDTFSYVDEKIPFVSLFEIEGKMCPLYSVFMFTKNAFTVAGGYPEEHGFDTQGFAWRFLAQNLHAETCPDTNYLHRVKASKSYYLREYGSGNINFNWQKIFVEHLDLFNDEAKRFILQYKCQDFTENIFDKMKIKARVLDDNYKEAILTGRIIEKSSFLNQERPVSKNSLRGIFFRMRSRFKKSFANDSVIYESIKSIRSTISEIKGRLHSERNLKLIFAVLLLKIKRLLKIQFEMEKPKLASPIDIVIPTLNKDLVLLESYLIYLRKNLMHEIMNIYIVAPASDPYLISYCTENNLIFIDEKKVLGYGKEAISYKVGEVDRSGWLFQQLLKLSGDVFVKNKNYLIIDSDTILINNHCFLYGSKTVFLASSEWNEPYFKSFSRLFGFVNKTPLSFTAHMMLFNVDKLREMKADISKLHKKTWDKAYIESCDRSEMSGISDYDTYAQWYMEKYPDQAIIIPFYNKSMPRARHKELSSLSTKCSCSFNSLSFHSYN